MFKRGRVPTNLTVTLLPTTMIGSYPKPRWFKEYNVEGTDLLEWRKLEKRFRAYRDATAACLEARKTLQTILRRNPLIPLRLAAARHSEVSAFNHAFRRWIGQSPSDYRRLGAVHFKICHTEEAVAAWGSI